MKRIAIIEDDDLMREVIIRLFAKNDLEASPYRSAADALDSMLSDPPDLIVTDIKMPKMSGLELLERLRDEGVHVPAILITAHPSDDVMAAARDLGVSHVLKKPFKQLDRLTNAVRSVLSALAQPDSGGGTEEVLEGLDELRLALLTDLSHQLRTPLTAMKLAMEGLFDQLSAVMDPAQERLANISRRNIDRIVTLVENQLALLQMTMGEVAVARRLVDVGAMLDAVVTRHPDVTLANENAPPTLRSATDRSAYLFTDPDCITKLLNCLLAGGPPNAHRALEWEMDEDAAMCHISIRIEYLSPTDPPGVAGAEDGDDAALRIAPSMSPHDFERRAFASIAALLGADVTMEKDPNRKFVRVSLPVCPDYDREKDFLNPVRALRKTAESKRHGVAVVKCDFGDHPGNGTMGATEIHFLERSQAVLSDGDHLLRGRRPGSYYLALIDRTDDDLERITSYLAKCLIDTETGDPLHVSNPQTIISDPTTVNRLVDSLDAL